MSIGSGLSGVVPRASGGSSALRLTVAAVGVVYGDIGTSPLYALRECFFGGRDHSVRPSEANVLGVLSLFFWSLMLVVTVKYVLFLLRADNKGEGGILSLVALLPGLRGRGPADPRIPLVALFACFGAALLLGDGMITPAISVLSAVEGLRVTTAVPQWLVIGLTCVILVALFAVQRRGTSRVGAIFGPVMIVWFTVIAVLGIRQVALEPHVVAALSPYYAARFFLANGLRGFTVLGAVVLCVTGGEALYADMGHFGVAPIRRAWLLLVFPALLASYFGQGAYLLHARTVEQNTFFAIVPHIAILRFGMVLLATSATVIASQALISGAFSLTRQAVQLGMFPRVTVRHTSGETEGQIYIPEVNWLLMVCCVALVLTFRQSGHLAAAYGIAVTGTMALTSALYFEVLRKRFRWSLPLAGGLVLLFLIMDLGFFGANALKLFDGGLVPLVIAGLIFLVMTTWRTGRATLAGWILGHTVTTDEFLRQLRDRQPPRVPGTAVFMTSNPKGVPPVLLHHWRHNQALHEHIVLLSIVSRDVPTVAVADRLSIVELPEGLLQVEAEFGFMETPNVPEVLRLAALRGVPLDLEHLTYFLGRESLLTDGTSGLAHWRKTLFAFISRNARPATAYFGIPPHRVVELGIQIRI